jgi:hypothetical protein
MDFGVDISDVARTREAKITLKREMLQLYHHYREADFTPEETKLMIQGGIEAMDEQSRRVKLIVMHWIDAEIAKERMVSSVSPVEYEK